MVSKLFYFNIFGIIILTSGNPAFLEDPLKGEAQYDIKKILEVLSKQVNKDVPSDHHKLYHQRNNQKDLTYIGDKLNGQYKNEESEKGLLKKKSNYLQNPTLHKLNLFPRNNNNDLTVETKKCEERFGKCTEISWNDTNPLTPSNMKYGKKDETIEKQINAVVTNNDVLKFLNNVDKTLKLDGSANLEMRCYGNGCRNDDDHSSNTDESFHRNYNDNNYEENLRCNGKRCNNNRQDDKNDRDINLRCYGNKCNRGNLDDSIRNVVNGSYKHIANISRSNSNNYDRNGWMDTLRCIGDQCNKDRDSERGDKYNAKGDRGRLRCLGDRCGINRDGDDEVVKENDEGNRYDRYDIGYDRHKFRCIGNKCGRSRGDDTIKYSDKDDRGRLQCFGNKCVRIKEDNYRNAKYNDEGHTYTDISYTSAEDGKVICYGNKCIKSRSRQSRHEIIPKQLEPKIFNLSDPVAAHVDKLFGIVKKRIDHQLDIILSNARNAVVQLIKWHYNRAEIPHSKISIPRPS